MINKITTDAFLLAVLSASGYGLAFIYELGYSSYYGYPTHLIKPTVNIIVIALFFVMFWGVGLTQALSIIFHKESPLQSKQISFVFIYICINAYVLHTMYRLMNIQNLSIAIIILSMLIVVSCLCGPAYLTFKKLKDSSISHIFFSGGESVSIILFLVFAFFSRGYISAHDEDKFFFLKDKKDYAVLRIYDKTAIAIHYDSINKRFDREYYVFNVENEKNAFELLRKTIKNDF